MKNPDRRHARVQSLQNGANLCRHSTRDRSVFKAATQIRGRGKSQRPSVAIENSVLVRQKDQILSAQGASQRAGSHVGIDVVGFAADSAPQGSDDRNRRLAGAHEVLEPFGLDLFNQTDKPQLGSRWTAKQSATINTRDSHGGKSARVKVPHELAVHRARQDHLDDVHHFGRGDALAANELPLDAATNELGIDGRASAVDKGDLVVVLQVLLQGFGDLFENALVFEARSAQFNQHS